MEENGEQQNPTATTTPDRPTESPDTPPPVTTTQTRPVASTVPTFGATGRDKYTMTTGEVRAIFFRDGLFRAPRSIERYCKEEKLDCFLDPDEKRYYVRPESVGTLISHIKEVNARQQAPTPFATFVGTANTPPTPVPSPNAPPVGESGGESENVEKLQNQIVTLKIGDKAKDQIIAHLTSQITGDRKEFISALVQHTRRVGELEQKLLQLEGPKKAQEGGEKKPVDFSGFNGATA